MPSVCFDVDGTLIYQVGEKEDTPRYNVIAFFRFLEHFGCEMYVWSGEGVEYAEKWCKKLGLNAKIVPKGSFVPDIAVDDLDVSLGRVNIKVSSFNDKEPLY